MGNEDYRKAYETATGELEKLLGEQEKMEKRVLALRKTLNVLSTLCQQEGMDTTDLDRRYAHLMEVVESSLTRDILQIVRNSAGGITAAEIREELIKLGGSLAEHRNPLATIHAVLSRLTESGRVKETLKNGKKAWSQRLLVPFAQRMKNFDGAVKRK
jgi:predicted nuclease with TOPRIM domain